MRRTELALVMGLAVERTQKFARDRSLWIVLTSSIVTVGTTVTVLALTPE